MSDCKLADNKCVPCKGDVPALNHHEVQSFLAQLDGWEVEADKKLIKTYSFKNFLQAMAFANAITPIAEAEGHHPDLYVRWGEVRVYLWTHKIDGLTESDFFMAAKLDRVRENLKID